MIDFLKYVWKIFSEITLIDILDIIIVAVLLYGVYKFIRERRAGRLTIGLIILVSMLFLSVIFHFRALSFILQNVFQVGILALIIVFQPELRSALEKVGGGEPLRGLRVIGEGKDSELAQTATMIGEITQAVCDMSLDKTGALIVIEQNTKLGDVIKSGTVINADVNAFLIRNIFFNKAPMHDGATVIRDGRIWASGCFLPLSTNNDIIKDLGTRHRAAIGMSENSDAIVIVVSEETGTVSLAKDGQLTRNLSYYSLKKLLTELMIDQKMTTVARKGVFFFGKKDKKQQRKDAEQPRDGGKHE